MSNLTRSVVPISKQLWRKTEMPLIKDKWEGKLWELPCMPIGAAPFRAEMGTAVPGIKQSLIGLGG
jgi:hypothetical protein